MINVVVDGKRIGVEKGTTILEAAKKLGIEIPTFCWHEKLEPFGGCRLCLVEVQNVPKLQIACATEASDGMVVRTNSARVIKARRGVLEFLLINHPLDCPTCDKGGECELQDAAFKHGSDKSRFAEEKRRYSADGGSSFDDLLIGPKIVRNMNRCIHCLKCVRFTHEIACENDLGAFERGYRTKIDTLPDIPVENNLSGNVIELCPVGALTSKPFRYKIRSWLLERTGTICPNCGDGCNISVWTKDSRLYRVTSNRNDKIDEGFICDKGRFGCEFVNSKDRLESPLVKKGNGLERASWEEAFDLIVNRLGEIKDKWGSEALGGVGSGLCTNEDNYVFQKFLRIALGTNNIDFRVDLSSLLPSPDLSKYETIYSMTNSIADLEKARMILVFGSDLASQHPIVGLRIRKAKRKNNAALTLFNPAKTGIGVLADREVVYKKGTELALINGLLNLVVNDSRFKSSNPNLDENTLKNIREELKSYTAEKVCSICEIEEEWLRKLKEDILLTASLVILAGDGVLDHPQNREIIRSLNNLLILSGHQGEKESGFNLLWPDCNSQGAMDMGVLPDRLPGLISVSDEGGRKRLEGLWNAKIPEKAGYSFARMLEAISNGSLRGIYFMQTDPFLTCLDRDLTRNALEKLDFIVVQDVFPSELSRMADVVLPACTFIEKDGTFTNVERRAQRLRRGFDTLYNSKNDWQIIDELALSMGYDFGYNSSAEITKEIGEVIPLYSGIRYDTLTGDGFQWSSPALQNRTHSDIEIAQYKGLSEK